jgi:ribosomal protein L44E
LSVFGVNEPETGNQKPLQPCIMRNDAYFCPSFFNHYTMSVTRLKRKNRKDKAKSARRRTALKTEGFKPVAKSVDIEKIKESFKKKA